MKKVLMSAVMLAMLAASCQNEQIAENKEVQKGEFFTLKVGRGLESRTCLNGKITEWSEDDRIFVSGANGEVSGVMKFVKYVGTDKSQAEFSGYISGGQPSELEHIVFPVPVNGKIDMSARKEGKLDAPMIGAISGGNVVNLNNVGSLLAINVEGNADLSVKADGIIGGESVNVTGGYYTFENGKLKYHSQDGTTNAFIQGGYAYVPVATSTQTDATGSTGNESVEIEKVEVYKVAGEDEELVGVTQIANGLTVGGGTILGDDEGEEGLPEISVEKSGDVVTVISTVDELKVAFGNGGNYKLIENFEGTLTETLKVAEGIELNLNLNEQTLVIAGSLDWGLNNRGVLEMGHGNIKYQSDKKDRNGAAIVNYNEIIMNDVDVTSNDRCFYNYGHLDYNTPLGEMRAEEAIVTAEINGGIFSSSLVKEDGHGLHRYVITGAQGSNMVLERCSLEGCGGVYVNVAFGTLVEVDAKHACTEGAHDFYVACGNAKVIDCYFENAAAFCDNKWGPAVVTKVKDGKEKTTVYSLATGETEKTTGIKFEK